VKLVRLEEEEGPAVKPAKSQRKNTNVYTPTSYRVIRRAKVHAESNLLHDSQISRIGHSSLCLSRDLPFVQPLPFHVE